jgi:TfoX/Sxy family transcriptional regulator of competence genes
MAYDETLAARTRAIMQDFASVEERKMFGGLSFMYKDRMCCGVLREDLVVKLAPERAIEALTEAHVRPMDFTGRPMPGMLYVSPEGVADDASLRRWVRESVAFVDSLPAKALKTGRR